MIKHWDKITIVLLLISFGWYLVSDYMDCKAKGGTYVRGLIVMECVK